MEVVGAGEVWVGEEGGAGWGVSEGRVDGPVHQVYQ